VGIQPFPSNTAQWRLAIAALFFMRAHLRVAGFGLGQQVSQA